MTKKDFQLLADAFQAVPSAQTMYPENNDIQFGYLAAMNRVVAAVCDQLRKSNPKFDRTRFLRAAGFKALAELLDENDAAE